GDAHLIVAQVDAGSQDTLKDVADRVRSKLKPALVVLGANINGRPAFLVAATPELVGRGVHAGNLIKDIASVAGGGGGGKPDLAQAGAKDPGRLADALEAARRLGREALEG
ncbi:MAG: DHHA1 domain-containing protein, partial [Tepidiformaceae bacterium]